MVFRPVNKRNVAPTDENTVPPGKLLFRGLLSVAPHQDQTCVASVGLVLVVLPGLLRPVSKGLTNRIST